MSNTNVTDFRLPLWVSGDWNAFFGLGINSLTNLLVLSGLLLNVIEMPSEIVFGRIVPAVGLMTVISNLYYFFMARRLAYKTGRADITSMPAGPSVPHMFIVVLVIMLPVKIATGDPVLAWQVGLAWAFIEGLINISGAFVAPYIRRLTPRAALGLDRVYRFASSAADLYDTVHWIDRTGDRFWRLVCGS